MKYPTCSKPWTLCAIFSDTPIDGENTRCFMFELSNEQTLMTSDDGTVRLTTYRVIYQTEKIKRQLMLEDFESYELTKSHIGNYSLLMVIFSILSLVMLIVRINEYFKYPQFLRSFRPAFPEFLFRNFAFDVPLFLSLLSLLFLLIARRYYLRLNGKFDSLDIRINNPRRESVKRFLEIMTAQSAAIKSQTPSRKHNIPG
jgi:hypothetical protein